MDPDIHVPVDELIEVDHEAFLVIRPAGATVVHMRACAPLATAALRPRALLEPRGRIRTLACDTELAVSEAEVQRRSHSQQPCPLAAVS
jgi:hypothetical protein